MVGTNNRKGRRQRRISHESASEPEPNESDFDNRRRSSLRSSRRLRLHSDGSSDDDRAGTRKKKKKSSMTVTEEEITECMVTMAQRKAMEAVNKLKTDTVLGHSNDLNRFGDSNLNEKILPGKKTERDVAQGVPMDSLSVKAGKKRQRERMMSDKDRGKAKVSKGHLAKQHLRRPIQIASTTFLASSSSPAFPHCTTPPSTSHFRSPPSILGGQSPPIPQPLSPHTHHVVPPTQSSPHSHQSSAPPTDGGPAPRASESQAASDTQSSGDKTILYLDGQGFLPSRPAANGIGNILKKNYTDPWPSWKKIPGPVRDLWFAKFTKKFSIFPPDDRWARKNFEMRGAVILKNSLNKARSATNKPSWLEGDVWDRLCKHWESEAFKKKSRQAKTNRASDYGGFGGSLHTGGSITTSQHKANMTKLTGITPTPLDLFRRTHQHKDNTWVDRRSAHIDAKFTRTWEELTQRASAQGTPPPSKLDLWRDVAGMKRGRVYGLGSESTVVAGGPFYQSLISSSSEWVRREEFEELRKKMEEIEMERDELRVRVANTERDIQRIMKRINLRPSS